MSLRLLQMLTLLFLGSLFALTGLRQFFVEPLANPLPNGVWFGLQVLPILGVLPGVLTLKARSYLFATLVAMLYFCHGVLVAVDPGMRGFGLWEVGFSLSLVFTATLTLRHLQRALTASTAGNDGSPER